MPAGSRPVAGSSSRSSLGSRKQRGGDPEPLAHPVRVAAHPVLGPVGQLDGLERLIDPLARAVAVERGQQLEVAPAVQVRIEGGRLDEAGDAVERVHRLERIAPEQPDAPLGGPDQPQHHPQARGLAGAVGPEVPVHVAGVDGQIDARHRGQLAVALDEAPDLDRRRTGARAGVGRRGVGHAQGASCLAADSAAIGGTEPSTV